MCDQNIETKNSHVILQNIEKKFGVLFSSKIYIHVFIDICSIYLAK